MLINSLYLSKDCSYSIINTTCKSTSLKLTNMKWTQFLCSDCLRYILNKPLEEIKYTFSWCVKTWKFTAMLTSSNESENAVCWLMQHYWLGGNRVFLTRYLMRWLYLSPHMALKMYAFIANVQCSDHLVL